MTTSTKKLKTPTTKKSEIPTTTATTLLPRGDHSAHKTYDAYHPQGTSKVKQYEVTPKNYCKKKGLSETL